MIFLFWIFNFLILRFLFVSFLIDFIFSAKISIYIFIITNFMLNPWVCLYSYFKILFINSNIWDILASVFINCQSLKFIILLLILTIKFLLYAGLHNDILFWVWIIWTSFYESWLLFLWAAKVLKTLLDPVWLYFLIELSYVGLNLSLTYDLGTVP